MAEHEQGLRAEILEGLALSPATPEGGGLPSSTPADQLRATLDLLGWVPVIQCDSVPPGEVRLVNVYEQDGEVKCSMVTITNVF